MTGTEARYFNATTSTSRITVVEKNKSTTKMSMVTMTRLRGGIILVGISQFICVNLLLKIRLHKI